MPGGPPARTWGLVRSRQAFDRTDGASHGCDASGPPSGMAGGRGGRRGARRGLADFQLGPVSPGRMGHVQGVAHPREKVRGHVVAGCNHRHRLGPHLVVKRFPSDSHRKSVPSASPCRLVKAQPLSARTSLPGTADPPGSSCKRFSCDIRCIEHISREVNVFHVLEDQ